MRAHHLKTLRSCQTFNSDRAAMTTSQPAWRSAPPPGSTAALISMSAPARRPSPSRDRSRESGLDHVRFLARLVELELIDRERRMIERRIKAAKFPAVTSTTSLSGMLRMPCRAADQLRLQGDPGAQQNAGAGTGPLRMDITTARDYLPLLEKKIMSSPLVQGTCREFRPCKTHVALGLGLAVCQDRPAQGLLCCAVEKRASSPAAQRLDTPELLRAHHLHELMEARGPSGGTGADRP